MGVVLHLHGVAAPVGGVAGEPAEGHRVVGSGPAVAVTGVPVAVVPRLAVRAVLGKQVGGGDAH